MKTVAELSWNSNFLKWVNEQEQYQNYCRLPVQQLTTAGVPDTQQLMLLPFEMMRQHMEDVMLQQLEIATGLYLKQAKEFENAFIAYIDSKHR